MKRKLVLVLLLLLWIPHVAKANAEGRWSAGLELDYEELYGGVAVHIAPALWMTKDGFDFDLDALRFNYATKHYEVGIGYQNIHWGPGYYGQLAMGSSALPVKQVYYKGVWGLGNYIDVEFGQFGSILEKENNRHFFGHWLQSEISPGLTVGITETAVVTGDFHPVFYNPLFFWPYYLTQHLSIKLDHSQDQNCNIGIGMFANYRVNQQRVYGELFVDDFPQFSNHKVPKSIAFQLGYEASDLRYGLTAHLEYTRIHSFVYVHRNYQNRYSLDGRSLGHWLGPDGDVFAFGAEIPLKKNFDLEVALMNIRKGEGDYTKPWNKETAVESEFLTGVIEKRNRLLLTGTHGVTSDYDIVVKTTLDFVQNVDHVENTQGVDYDVTVSLKWKM